MGKSNKEIEKEYNEVNKDIDEQEEVTAYMKRAETFYDALLAYLMLPKDKTPETVVQSAFGAIEFGCIVAMQAQITEEDFKNTVNAIWEGIKNRHEYSKDEASVDGEDEGSAEDAVASQPSG